MRGKLLAMTVTVGVLLGSVSICGAEEIKLFFSGGTPASVPTIICSVAGEILSRSIPGVKTGVEPGGSVANIMKVEKGEVDIGICHMSGLYDAWEGNEPFEYPYRNIRFLMALQPHVFQVVALEQAGLKTIKDVVGKTYSPSKPGQSSWEMAKKVLESYELTMEDIEKGGGQITALGWSEVNMRLKDKTVDVTSWCTAAPHATFVDVGSVRRLQLVPFGEGMLEKFLNDYKEFSEFVIPAGTYSWQKTDYRTAGTILVFLVHKDASEDLAYKIVKALVENKADLVSAYKGCEYISKLTLIYGAKIPVHPGVLRYCQEVGILPPGLD